MLDPKIFYRKLDSILSKIGLEKSGKDFLFLIVNELEKTFGDDLHISNGRIYEERGNEYVLISQSGESSKKVTQKIPASSEALQALMKTKTYIFDNYSLTIDKSVSSHKEYRIPAAMLIRSTDATWIFVFELKSGWVREEIEFCFNAVRTVLNYRFISEAAKNEVEQAAHIQQSLLPAIPPEFPGFTIAGHSKPAELVGGDLYDYFIYDNDELGVCIGDASGHGLPAALLVRDVVTGLRMGLEKHTKMVYTFKQLNKVIYQSVYSTRFISLFYAEIERDGNIVFVNAGHPSPLLYNGISFNELESTGLIFGALPEIQLSRGYAVMKPGDVLVLYTDGIIERKNSSLEEFSIERLKDVIKSSWKKSATEIKDEIFSASYNFAQQSRWEDDATVVVIKRENL